MLSLSFENNDWLKRATPLAMGTEAKKTLIAA
jgi:hypothetical protein